MSIVNPLGPLSYTNKDFQEIFPEQLDLVKNLTDKWDPSQSNESDPGVILLKANAVIADKNNYQIDKNVLELSPDSVTQDANARKLFSQLGYNMRWYTSATTTITLKYLPSEDETDTSDIVIIPPFTMVSDSSSDKVYTLLGMVSNVGSSDSLSVKDNYPSKFIGNILLSKSGESVAVAAIQGSIEPLTVMNETRITFDRLNNDNRLYFDTSYVAQNGVFIQNANPRDVNTGLGNFSEWARVDNITTQNLDAKVFSFGVDADTNSCYIEFSENIATEIGSGIYVYYVISNGAEGNITARSIETFYGGATGTSLSTAESVELSEDNVSLSNLNSAINGDNPESISEAYRNYKKTVGTFDTLVTTRDYQNAVNSSQLVSNSFVCDRNNDLQYSYKVVSQISEDISALKSKSLKDKSGNPYLTAFDLKIYPLKYVEDTSDVDSYNESFELDTNILKKDILEGYLENNRCVSHDFKEIETAEFPAMNAEMFINEYAISCKVIPNYELTQLQRDEVEENIKKALYSKLSSKDIDFGEAPDYDTIYDIILNSDERIKTIFLDDLSYNTYFNSGETTYPLLGSDLKNREIQTQIVARSILAGKTPLFKSDNDFAYSIDQEMQGVLENIEKIDTETIISVKSGEETTVRENESIVFYAPEYETKLTYSTYVKYIYRLTSDTLGEGKTQMNANSIFQLQGNDCLITFTKSSEDSQYEYNKYSAGDYIKCSFALPENSARTDNDNIIAFCSAKKGILTNYEYEQEIYNRPSDESSLGTSKTITILNPGTTKIDSGKCYCYWYLNSTNKEGNYELFPEVENTSSNPITQSYVLGSGEYFVYTSSSQVNLTIVGQGTRISRTIPSGKTSSIWSVKPLPLTTITQGALDGINTSLMIPVNTSDTPLDIQKMQFIELPEKSTLVISKDNIETTYVIKKDGIYKKDTEGTNLEKISLSDVNVTYKLPESSSMTKLPEIVFSNEGGWSVKSLLSLGISSEVSQKIKDNQRILYTYVTNEGKKEGILEGTSEGIDVLSNYVVLMTGENSVNTTFTDSKGIIRYLNLYTFQKKPSVENVSYSNNKTTLTFNVKRSKGSTGTISDKKINIGNVYTNSDSIYISLNYNGEQDYLYIRNKMVYNNKNEKVGSVTASDSYIVNSIDFDSNRYDGYTYTIYYNSSSQVAIAFKVPEGEYILPLVLTDTAQIMKVSSAGNDVTDIAEKSLFNVPKTYYLDLSSDGIKEISLTFTLYDGYYDSGIPTSTTTSFYRNINLKTLFKYVNMPAYIEGDTGNINLINTIKLIDQDNMYDYTYQVPTADSIPDPLSSYSFNDSNHVMNPYTINKIGSIDVVVSSRTR